VIIGQDQVGDGFEAGEELELGLHPFLEGIEAGAAELVEEQPGVVLTVFEQEDAERSGHGRLPFRWRRSGSDPLPEHGMRGFVVKRFGMEPPDPFGVVIGVGCSSPQTRGTATGIDLSIVGRMPEESC
jgi:hypothetical protein